MQKHVEVAESISMAFKTSGYPLMEPMMRPYFILECIQEYDDETLDVIQHIKNPACYLMMTELFHRGAPKTFIRDFIYLSKAIDDTMMSGSSNTYAMIDYSSNYKDLCPQYLDQRYPQLRLEQLTAIVKIIDWHEYACTCGLTKVVEYDRVPFGDPMNYRGKPTPVKVFPDGDMLRFLLNRKDDTSQVVDLIIARHISDPNGLPSLITEQKKIASPLTEGTL